MVGVVACGQRSWTPGIVMVGVVACGQRSWTPGIVMVGVVLLVVLVLLGILCRPQGLEFHSLLLPAASEAGRQVL